MFGVLQLTSAIIFHFLISHGVVTSFVTCANLHRSQAPLQLGAILAPLHGNDHCSRKGSSWTNLLGIVTVISSERVGRLLLAAIMSHFRKINLFLGFHVGPKLRPKQLFWAFVSGP